MQLETKNTTGKKVLIESSGKLVALLNLPIINPSTGVIEAFWVKTGLPGLHDAIIKTEDIRAFKKNIYIESELKIQDPGQILKIAQILEQNKPYFGQKVLGVNQKSYGLLWNISFSSETLIIKQLFTKKLLGLKKHVFSAKLISEVTQESILINDDNTQKIIDSTPEVG